ncbi:hypothetical protein HEM13_010905 [Escherichia coli]|nr:hypothetical protein [Escherichia coli]
MASVPLKLNLRIVLKISTVWLISSAKQASDARAQEVAGSEVLYSGDANLTDEQIAKLPFALYRQGYEYYWKTHAHPNIFRSVRDIVPSKRWLL